MISNLLPHLHYFYAVASEQGFSAAAIKLSISQSAVSLQIARLEEKLGVGLFHREGRRDVILTKAGEDLLHLCQDIFPKLEASQALGKLSTQTTEPPIRLTSPSLFGTYSVLPFIKIFEKRHPGLKVLPEISDRVADLQRENLDLAIRWKLRKNVKPGDLLLRRIPFAFIASKSYLATSPAIKTIADIQKHTLIVHGEHHVFFNQWHTLLPKREREMPKKILVIDNTLAQIEAVRQSFGLAVLPLTVLDLPDYKKSLSAVLPNLNYQLGIYGCVAPTHHKSRIHNLFLNEFKAYLNPS